MLIFITSIALLVCLTYLFIYYKYEFVLNIKAKTIHLQKPILLANNTTQRKSIAPTKKAENLIIQEDFLRKLAYKNTSIKTTETFFNDTDMQSDYFLIIICHNKTNTPLLTARYYFDATAITTLTTVNYF